MSTKSAVIELIQQMPDEVTVTEIIAELQVRHNIETGLRRLDAGQGIDHEDVQKRLAKWLD